MKKKYLDNLKIIIAFLFMFYTTFTLFFKFHLGSDAYRVIYNNSEYIVNLKMVEGRPIQAMYFKLVDITTKGMDNITKYTGIYRIGLVMSGLITAISFYLVYKNIKKIINVKSKQKRILIFILVASIFINITICEYMLFLENVVMALGILFAVLATLIVSSTRKNVIKYSLCYLLLVLSTFCYQGTTQLFVILSLLNFILSNINKLDKQNVSPQKIIKIEKNEYITTLIKIFVLYFGAQGVSYIICVWYNKLYPDLDPRLITGIVKNLRSLISYNVVNIYRVNIIILIFIMFYNLITPEDRNTKSNLINMTLLFFASFISYIIFIFNNSAALVPRSVYNLIIILPVLELYIINLEYKKFFKFNVWIIFLYVVLNILLSVFFQNLNIISTKQNIEAVNKIIYRINEYENTNNIKVEEIAFYKDESPNYEYWHAPLNILSTYTNPVYYGYWSDIYSINVLAHRNFKKVTSENLNEDLVLYFKSKDWVNLNLDEQMIFDGNRVSICKF